MPNAPRCPSCGQAMTLAHTLPHEPGEEEINVFRCGLCNVHFTTKDHHPVSGSLSS